METRRWRNWSRLLAIARSENLLYDGSSLLVKRTYFAFLYFFFFFATQFYFDTTLQLHGMWIGTLFSLSMANCMRERRSFSVLLGKVRKRGEGGEREGDLFCVAFYGTFFSCMEEFHGPDWDKLNIAFFFLLLIIPAY